MLIDVLAGDEYPSVMPVTALPMAAIEENRRTLHSRCGPRTSSLTVAKTLLVFLFETKDSDSLELSISDSLLVLTDE